MRSRSCPSFRKHVSLAHEFESLLLEDDGRFEIPVPVTLGLVCFRLAGCDNETNERLNKSINDEGEIHLTPSKVGDMFILRMAVCSRFTEFEDILKTYEIVKRHADKITKEARVATN